jgi:hypothetical protein
MNTLLTLFFQQLIDSNYLFAIISLDVALLSSTLIFIGFVQVALSNSLNGPENRLIRQVNHLVSKGIIRRVRIVVVMTVSGALFGWTGYVTANIIVAAIASFLFLMTLLVVGSLSYSITNEFLFLSAGDIDNNKDNL